MDLKLEVIFSSSIKRKKPWPQFCWLGQEKESVFLLDDKRISEINMVSGRTKKKTPKLHPFLSNVVTMASSHNGMWLCGLLVSGELFLWNRDKDLLKTAAAVPEVVQLITSSQENAKNLCLHVSSDGVRALLVAKTGQVFLWECSDVRDFAGGKDGPVKGQWTNIQHLEDNLLPTLLDKEASQHTIFVKNEVMGDICLTAFIFTCGKKLIVTFLKIYWKESFLNMGPIRYSVQWATKTYPLSSLRPPCQPVKSRGALVQAFSPDGRLLAIVLNQRKPNATQVLFVSTQNFVSVSSDLGGCGSKKMDIPSKYIRSYWVGGVSWSPGGLFLACVLKRGSLLMLARLGSLLTLTSTGCNVDFGPAHFLPLHPLVTYRPPMSAGKGEASLSSSSLSVRDVMRQRFSVTWHPRLMYFIVSDGYMATFLRVLDRPSPAAFVNVLLTDACKALERASSKLDKSKAWVESWLNLGCGFEELDTTFTSRPKTPVFIHSECTSTSGLPLFLQDQSTAGGTKELLENIQAFFEDESDFEGPYASSYVKDSGRLEFASMFDSLHALDTQAKQTNYEKDSAQKEMDLQPDLSKIQRKLLTAWAFCMSLGDAVEHRVYLLKHTLFCVVRFIALLHLVPNPVIQTEEKKMCSSDYLLQLIKSILSFLSWANTSSDGSHCLSLMVEFSRSIVRLLLSFHSDSNQTLAGPISSQSLFIIVQILELVSNSLDQTYSLKQRTCWSSELEVNTSEPEVWVSDLHHVPLLHDGKEKSSFTQQASPVPQRASSRLLGVWQLLYDVTQLYAEELNRCKVYDGWKEENEKVSLIMSKIQTALQATGERLDDGSALLNYPGEHLFLCGLYPESAEALQLQICHEANKNSGRSIFQEVRLCLALLYSLLSRYRLKEAQELGDHMAQLIQLRSGTHTEGSTDVTGSLPCSWLPFNLHSDAAISVVRTLGRFMASYFTNQPLFILPTHNVGVLPPLHFPHELSVDRLVPLCQKDAARAVRQQHLSEVWTVDYAQDLLLLGGLLPEAVWLSYHLGDWKTAVTLSLAYDTFNTEHLDFAQLRVRELHLPKELKPERIFQAELWGLLGNKTDSLEWAYTESHESLIAPLEEENCGFLPSSLQESLKASVMAGVDVLSSILSSLLEKAKHTSSSLPALVPAGLYLPSPPLYCPQPSPNSQDQLGPSGHIAEVICRHKISGALQRLILVLRSAHCCLPATQWYINRLRRAKHVLHKIKQKYSYPSAAQEEAPLLEGLMKFYSAFGYFRQRSKKEDHLEPDIICAITCFREICALCWMFHVRDQLSLHCRKYQNARQNHRDDGITNNPEVESACVSALQWARRFLPFSRFLNAEEVIQDILLSLMSELPPMAMVADTIAEAFPQEAESVRVSLREKYNLLLKRLGQSNVHEEGAQESMKILIQDKKRQRRKHLARLQRHLAPPLLHLWEKEEAEEDRRRVKQPVCVKTSTPVPCQHSADKTRSKRLEKKKYLQKSEKTERQKEQLSLPVLGTWEFELEDEEYLNFLELFLSYVLEKESSNGGDLPLLKSFCPELRQRELHSLTFDVVSTVQRRQRGGNYQAWKHVGNVQPVFRAGSSYRVVKQGAELDQHFFPGWSEAPKSKASNQKGLFSLRQQSRMTSVRANEAVVAPESSLHQTHPSESFISGSVLAPEAVTDLQQGLDPELEAQFPDLGRLLEWMVRWADRALLAHHGKKKKKDAKADEGVVIRVRVSAPAILASLRLLKQKHTTLQETKGRLSHIQASDVPCTVASVLHSDVEKRLDRESSVDTGYPGSANTLITGLDHIPQPGEPSIGSHTDETEELLFPETPNPAEQPQLKTELQQIPTGSQHYFFDLDLTPEKEDTSRDSKSSDGTLSRSCTFRNICTPETSLKLKDLDSEKTEELSISSFFDPPEHAELSPPLPPPPPIQLQVAVQTELSNTPDIDRPDAVADRPSSTSDAPAANATSFNQLPTASLMRQRLSEDLLRLVQHINYMSLSDVLGATLSSLQLTQQNTSLIQPNLKTSQPVRSSSNNNAQPANNGAPPQPHPQVPEPAVQEPSSDQIRPQTSTVVDHSLLPSTDGADGTDQEIQPLSIQAESDTQQELKKEKLIPCSQGLLTTTAATHTTELPSDRITNNLPAPPQILELKLLQLHPPPAQQSLLKPHQPRLKQKGLPTWKEKGREQRRICQPSGQSAGQVFPPLQAAHSVQGLCLLRLQDVPQTTVAFPDLPPQSTSTPILKAVPVTGAPAIKLLRIHSGSKLMVPQPCPSNTNPRLFSLEEINNSPILRWKTEESQLQGLQENTLIENIKSQTPNLRQKRREEKAKMKNPDVTFKPNESAVPTPDAVDVPACEEPATAEELKPGHNFPGYSDSPLTGQRLLDEAFSTSAELHAFASTMKRAPECHDAFTNTDPVSSPVLVDKTISVQASMMSCKTTSGQSPGHLEMVNEDPNQNTEEMLHDAERLPYQTGHQFLSILDLEGGTDHEALTPFPTLERQDRPFPPSFQLPALTTPVMSGAATPEPSATCLEQEATSPTDVPEESPLFSHSAPCRDSEVTDSFECKVVRAIRAQRLIPDGAPPSGSAAWISSQLSEMDAQLASLQNIAGHLEMDFSNSRLLVNRSEKLASEKESDVKKANVVKKTVRLSVPMRAWSQTPDPEVLTEAKKQREEKHTQQKFSENLSAPTTKPPSPCPPSQTTGPSYPHTLSDHSSDMDEISQEWADESRSEISDTVEILDELVKEGYLSPSDWDVSTSQPLHQSSQREEEARIGMSPRCSLLREERKELRMWMRQKQRERMAAYRKARVNLREREHKPFPAPRTEASANTNHRATPRSKEEAKKLLLLKQFELRTREACSLVGEVLVPPLPSSPRSTSAPPAGSSHRPHSVSLEEKGSPLSGRLCPPPVDRWVSEHLHRRLGLHRPVTVLPRDRLSQVTRRGMLSTSRSHAHIQAASQAEWGGRKAGNSGSAFRRGILKEPRRVNDTEEMEPPGPLRLQDLEESNTVSARVEPPPALTGGVSDMDWIDGLSESSSISNMDWASIESILSAAEV